jgi:predicted dehydrogenase
VRSKRDKQLAPLPRIGVIGTGWWASQYHIPSLLTYPGATLAAISDTDSERLELARKASKVAQGFEDPLEMMSREVVDGVIIATPHNTHYDLAAAALDAKIHTFVEKPLTIDPDHAWRLVELAETNGAHLSVGYTAQYDRAAQFLRSTFESGALGELLSINSTVATMLAPLLLGETARFAEDIALATVAPKASTYSDPARAGGGFAQSQLTHTIGMLLYVTGVAPVEVFAHTRSSGLSVDIVGAVAFTLDGGAIGTLGGTGSIGSSQKQMHELRYFGSEGFAIQNILLGETTVVSANGDETTVGPTRRSEPVANRAPARAFADLVAGRGPNYAPGDVGAHAVDFVAALYRSAESGRSEPIPRRHHSPSHPRSTTSARAQRGTP